MARSQITTYRIASRIPLHQPSRIDRELLGLFEEFRGKIEFALHVNHPAELFPEVRDALAAMAATGARSYNQTVLLRDLNANAAVLEALCEELRSLKIETHYLFHCVPIMGMSHHRTTIAAGLKLISQLTSGGRFSGRAKPNFALLTDVGKITPYEGTILAREGRMTLLQSHYSFEERMEINPGWRLPASAQLDRDGLLTVWYEDGVAADQALESR